MPNITADKAQKTGWAPDCTPATRAPDAFVVVRDEDGGWRHASHPTDPRMPPPRYTGDVYGSRSAATTRARFIWGVGKASR